MRAPWMTLPSVAHHRQIGEFRNVKVSPDGRILSETEWMTMKDQWLPSKSDGDFIESLMSPCWEVGKDASWLTPPKIGIDNKGGDFEYVKIHQA